MVETGKSAFRSFFSHRIVRIPLQIVLGLAGLVAAVVAAAAIYNAFDEDLTPEAKAMLAPPPMGKVEDRNGYVAFLGLVAPKGQDQMEWGRKAAAAFTAQAQPGFTRSAEWEKATRSHIKIPADRNKWCRPDCLSEAKSDGGAVARRLADPDNAELLARYRKVREAPEFAELYVGERVASFPRSHPALYAGSALSLSEAAGKANAGDPEALVAELEREVAFHRRMVDNGRMLITVMAGQSGLTRDLLVISEMVRFDAGSKLAGYGPRLRALTRPQVSAKALQPGFRFEAHEGVSWAKDWRQLLRETATPLPDNLQLSSNWTQSLFIRPNETINRVAALMRNEAAIADAATDQFDRQAAAIDAARNELLARPLYAEAFNPVGKSVAELVANSRLAPYAARMNDLQALERMVDLQVSIATSGPVAPDAVAAHVAGESAPRDPYTGKPFAFDPATRLLSFEPRAKIWGDMKKRYGGKVAIAL